MAEMNIKCKDLFIILANNYDFLKLLKVTLSSHKWLICMHSLEYDD